MTPGFKFTVFTRNVVSIIDVKIYRIENETWDVLDMSYTDVLTIEMFA